VNRAIDAAVEAQPAWAALTIRERVTKLRQFAELVKGNRLALGKTLSCETGKPYMAEAVWEFDSVAYVIEAACEVAMHHYGTSMPLGVEPGYDEDIQFAVHEPLGVIACIVPFNFPAALWAFKAGAALAAGNAIVVKPPTANPLAVIRMHELLVEAGVPATVAQCVTGEGSVVGSTLARDPRIAQISFTGSTATGVSIAKDAAENLTPQSVRAWRQRRAHHLLGRRHGSCRVGVGGQVTKLRAGLQRCQAVHRAQLRQGGVHTTVDRGAASPLKLGDPLDETTTMGPLVSEAAAKGVEQQVNATVAAGAKVAFGGHRKGAFYEPTVLVNVTLDMDIARDVEVFGPV